MASTTVLYITTNLTLSGNVVTFLTVPAAGVTTILYYSYKDPAASDGHSHILESKSDWDGIKTTWTLLHTPEIANDATKGEFFMLKTGAYADGTFWINYSDGTTSWVRQGLLSGPASALVISWLTVPISIPLADGANFIGSGADGIAYFSTNDGATPRVRIYRVDPATGIATVVFSLVTASSAHQIVRIWPRLQSGTLYFTLFSDGSYNPAVDGLYRSTDNGLTWAFLTKGYNAAGNFPVHAVAAVKAGAHAGRIYTVHSNTAGATNSVLSYSTDNGSTWTDVANTALNGFASGLYGYITLEPVDDDSYLVYYSVANGAGGIMTSIYDPATGTVTLNSQVTTITDSAFIESGFYLNRDTRILIHDNGGVNATVYRSTDKGASWTAIATIDTAVQNRYHLHSILPSKDWMVLRTPNVSTIHVCTDLGVTWQSIDIAATCGAGMTIRAICWVDGG